MAHIFSMMPAAHAFSVGAGRYLNRQRLPIDLDCRCIIWFSGQRLNPGVGGNQEEAQFIADPAQISRQFTLAVKVDLGIQPGTNPACDPQFFQFLADCLAHCDQAIPISSIQCFLIADRKQPLIPSGQKHRWAALAGQVPPQFLGGETQDRGQPAGHRFENMLHRGLRRAAGDAVAASGVLAIFDDVQIQTAQIH